MKPSVSIIIPVINNPIGIKTLIQSLKSQDYPTNRFEVIIVDNGSTDDTFKIVKNKIINFKNFHLVAENIMRGSYAARNRGILISKGKILAFTDSDCVPNNNWVSEGIKGLLSSSYDSGGGKVSFTFQRQKPNVHELFDSSQRLNQEYYVSESNFAITANLFIYRNVFYEIGMFDENLISSGDKEFGNRLHQNNIKITYMPHAIVQHPAKTTLKANIIKSIRLATGRKQLSNPAEIIRLKYRAENHLYKNFSKMELFKIIFIDLKIYINILIKRMIG